MSILTTAVNNITVLVSHNVIFFGCSMHMSHGVNKTPPSASPASFPIIRFSPNLFVVVKKRLYQPLFALIR